VRPKDDKDPSDYGQSALVAAANELSANPSSPAAYRAFRDKVDALRGKFSESVAEEAERYLVFLALGPLESVADRSREEQLQALALTVWPTVFEVKPREGESPKAYLERVCTTEMATECKHSVPDYWPVMLGAMVWTRLKERAHVAYRTCGSCTDDPGYVAALAKYDEQEGKWSALAGKAKDAAKPESWPVAGKNAKPWSGAPLLARDLDGKTFLDDAELSPRQLRKQLAERRGDRSVLGVYLNPRDRVETVRALLDDVAAAGYSEVAFLALDPHFPYAKKEYRLAIGRRARGAAVPSRNSDTVQVLVQALDAIAAGATGPLRLD